MKLFWNQYLHSVKKDWKNSYQVRQTLELFCSSTIQVSGYNYVKGLRITKIAIKNTFEEVRNAIKSQEIFHETIIYKISEANSRFHVKYHTIVKLEFLIFKSFFLLLITFSFFQEDSAFLYHSMKFIHFWDISSFHKILGHNLFGNFWGNL